jgi:phenylalanyl-tRNA synthetase alpha chain
VSFNGKKYITDDWYNVPPTIANLLHRRLHLEEDHPISVTRAIIESKFPSPSFHYHNEWNPVVSTEKNFDSLGIPADHPGRSKTDTYYINRETVLRTHTSAHQTQAFNSSTKDGFLISADVYRRDAIDRSHYPIFHQMEGARVWDRTKIPGGDLAKAVWADLEKLPKHNMTVEDPNPTTHPERNPLQPELSADETEAIAAHLKRSLELVVAEIFSRAKKAAGPGADGADSNEQLRVRWIEAYFPFTSPSWELEIFWQGEWLEVLGCGVVRQAVLERSSVPTQAGWAFGVGLERIAMLLFEIPDIRLFWSRDSRFLEQFRGVSGDWDLMKRFVPFSKYPACYKDVSFWVGSGGEAKAHEDVHENDVMETVRNVAGDQVEDVVKTDEFTHPKTGRRSLCYRINYRSLERTLTNLEVNKLHDEVRSALEEKLGVELR